MAVPIAALLGLAGGATSLLGGMRTSQSRNVEEFVKQRLAGRGPSPAEAALAAAHRRTAGVLNASAAGARGVAPGLALRNAQQAAQENMFNTSAQASQMRAQEQVNAQNSLYQIGQDEQRRKAALFGAIGQGLSAAGATALAGPAAAAVPAVAEVGRAAAGQTQAPSSPAPGASPIRRPDFQPAFFMNALQAQMEQQPYFPTQDAPGSVFPGILNFRSDERQKRNIQPAGPEVDQFIKSLRPRTFEMRQGGGRKMGVIAQEMERSEMGRGMVQNQPGGKTVDGSRAVQALMAAVGRLGERMEQRNASGGGAAGASAGSFSGSASGSIAPDTKPVAEGKYDGGAGMQRAIAAEAVRAQGGGDYEAGRGRILDRFALSDNPMSRSRLQELEEAPEVPYRAIWGDASGHASPYPFAQPPTQRDEAIPPRVAPQMNDARWPDRQLGLYEMSPAERQFVLQNAEKATGMTYSGLIRLGYERAAQDLMSESRARSAPIQGVERNPTVNQQQAAQPTAPNTVQQYTLTPMQEFTMEDRMAVRDLLISTGVSPQDVNRFLADPTFMDAALQILEGGQTGGAR